MAAVAAFLAGAACDTQPTADILNPSAVFIETVEDLSPPLLGTGRTYRPDRLIVVDEENPDRGSDATGYEAAAFFLSVATDRPADLKIRLAGALLAGPAQLLHVDTDHGDGETAASLSHATITTGTCGPSGCFWLTDDDTASDGEADLLSRRLAVVVPRALLAANPWLEVYVSETSNGEPLLAGRVQLARQFFYLAAIGDSVMWGNGLRERDKFTTLVANEIEAARGVKVVRLVHAISGATIVPFDGAGVCEEPCFGEVPTGLTPILEQADRMERPELMDLILLDGCANDVGLDAILSPETEPTELAANTRISCELDMTTLLEKVRVLAPQAPIVVTGYFPIISDESLELGAEELAVVQGIARSDLDEFEDPAAAMAVNSTVFNQEAKESLANAVDIVNAAGEGRPMVAFADPGYGEHNALFAADSWLWNLTAQPALADLLGYDMRLFPEDPLLDVRVETCFASDVFPDPILCVYGSLGHPNPAGARAYANEIIKALRQLEVLPPTPPDP